MALENGTLQERRNARKAQTPAFRKQSLGSVGVEVDALLLMARDLLPAITRNGAGGHEIVLEPKEHRITRYNDTDMHIRFRKSRTEPLRWEFREVFYLVPEAGNATIASVPTRTDAIMANITPHAKKFIEDWNQGHPERLVMIESFAGFDKLTVGDVKRFLEKRDNLPVVA